MSSRWENITNFLPYFWPMEQPNVFTCSGMTLAKLPAREPLMDSILYLGIFLTVWKFSLREPGTVSSLCPSAGICWLAAKQREVKERSLFLMASLGWWWERERERDCKTLFATTPGYNTETLLTCLQETCCHTEQWRTTQLFIVLLFQYVFSTNVFCRMDRFIACILKICYHKC